MWARVSIHRKAKMGAALQALYGWLSFLHNHYIQIGCPDIPSIHSTSPSYLQPCFHPCRRHDIKTTAAVFCLSSSRSTAHSTLQSADGRSHLPAPICGTTFHSTSHLHSHSRSSDSISRLSSSLVPTRMSWYDLLIIIDYYDCFLLAFSVDLAIIDIT